jgi:GntR family transcriptional regulator, transcriptional repressor for pyruvate dehydrogenase complex
MNEELIQVLATATRIACKMITSPRQAALQASLDQACDTPTGVGWDRKAAAHAEFFTALADATGDPRLTPVFNHGAGFAYNLMIGAGPAANGIVTNSRKRMLAHLRAGDAEQAALEMEEHLRILHFMGRLASLPAQRASA